MKQISGICLLNKAKGTTLLPSGKLTWSPENRWLQDGISSGMAYFQGRTVSFREYKLEMVSNPKSNLFIFFFDEAAMSSSMALKTHQGVAGTEVDIFDIVCWG